MATDQPESEIEAGEFPFAISKGEKESPYLTWVRNRSNYMAVQGLVDYTRAIGVLVRGALANFLIFVPYLLAISIAVALANFWEFPPPFVITKALVFLFLVSVVWFLVQTPLLRILRYTRIRATGSDSSVKRRNLYEQSFGVFLLAIFGLMAAESLPGLLDPFHKLVFERQLGWRPLAFMLAVTAAIFSAAPRLMSALGGGLAQHLALFAVGALGGVVPLLFVLFSADFMVYGPRVDWGPWMVIASFVILIGIAAAALLGALLRVWTARNYVVLILLVVGSAGLYWQINRAESRVFATHKTIQASLHNEILAELMRTPDEIEKLEADPKLASLRSLKGLTVATAKLRQEREPCPSESTNPRGTTPRLSELSELGHAAGLCPEFEAVLDWLRDRRTTCQPIAGECERLELEIRRLVDSTTTIKRLAAVRSLQDLAVDLIKLPQVDLGQLRSPALVDDKAYRSALETAKTSKYIGNLRSHFENARLEIANHLIDSPTILKDSSVAARVRKDAGTNDFPLRIFFVTVLATLLWVFCSLTIDVNLTSIHGLYRDRLASAFLMGTDASGSVNIEKDLDLMELCNHEAGSTAPYHLINTALNLQGSAAIEIRDRQSDFSIFSKRFIGGKRTGYCRSETMEAVFPQMDLATAMAISAAAVSPNMGRATSPALVAIMTLLNIRMGFWMPNPGLLEKWNWRKAGEKRKGNGYAFREVFDEELHEVEKRWAQLGPALGGERRLHVTPGLDRKPTTAHRLFGIGFSGGGIRSASVNLGIAQELHRRGVLRHIDYMSTVSGGGYLGSSISALMREKTKTVSAIAGTVQIEKVERNRTIVSILPQDGGETHEHCFESGAPIAVEAGDSVKPGQRLIRVDTSESTQLSSLGSLFYWRIRPSALLREIVGRVDETHRWVNVSDGGHIENLAGIELLRRRCKYIILGDAEADPEHHFDGLATLIRLARIDLGIHIEIDASPLRLCTDKQAENPRNVHERESNRVSLEHWAIGKIHYPKESTPGYLLYLKASVTGDEDEVIQQYRQASPSFPHESTADQFFGEGQFEAYRSLGQHMAERALTRSAESRPGAVEMSFEEVEAWFQKLLRDAGFRGEC